MDRSSRMLLGPAGAALAGLFVTVLALGWLAKLHGPLLPTHDHASHSHIAAKLNAASAETGTTFYAEVARVNKRMHEAMEVAPSGDADCDFMRMMIPHHQGAIDMARVLLKHGRDKRLTRLAQSIIVEQAQEIIYMQTLLGGPPEADASRQGCQ